MAYKITNTNSIIRLADNALIPMDENNRDYREYLLWVADGNISTAADPEFKDTWAGIRQIRNQLLVNSDWTQMGDAPLNALKKQNWADYRTQLRSIPQTFLTVSGVVWPTEPA